MTNATKLAAQLYRNDMSHADEVPVQRDGARAYDGWLRASSDAGDTKTREALEAVDRSEFAAAWEILVARDGARYGFEVRTRDGWSAEAAGQQDRSNLFATREAAAAEIPNLARALDVSEDEIRVADLG